MSAKIIPFPVIPRPRPANPPAVRRMPRQDTRISSDADDLAALEIARDEAVRAGRKAAHNAWRLLRRMERQIADLTAPPARDPNGGRSDAPR